SQRLPGGKVRFVSISLKDAVALALEAGKKRQKLLELRAAWRSRPAPTVLPVEEIPMPVTQGEALLHLDGEGHRVTWEEIKEE
ncbi:MAG: KipI antagonist, partial [Synergistaceae bacterium]|nr:KipI antagonist [Synergistaceae bacterium]